MKLVLVADPHLSAKSPTLFGLDPLARLEQCLEDIKKKHLDADLCVFMGDLTDKADIESYRQFGALVEKLPLPVRLLVGNHDRRHAFKVAFPNHCVDANGFVQSSLALESRRLIFLDTLEEGRGRGFLCPQRLQWIESELADAAKKDVLLFAHHSPFALAVPHMDPMRIVNSNELLRLLARHGRVKHFFFGHVHLPIQGCWNGIGFTGLRSTCHNIVLSLTGRDASFGHAQPSYAVVTVQEEAVLVHIEDMLGSRGPTFDGRTGERLT